VDGDGFNSFLLSEAAIPPPTVRYSSYIEISWDTSLTTGLVETLHVSVGSHLLSLADIINNVYHATGLSRAL
jgi:hypothetical protein